MARWIQATNVVTACGLVAAGCMAPSPALGQTRERDVTITGPGGRTIERKFQSTLTPGGLERQTTITRPGGTFTRDVHIARPMGGVMPPPPMRGWVPGPPRPFIVERGGVSGAQAFGIGALGAALGTGAGYLIGRATAPQPVVVAPAPMVVAGPPMMVAGPGVVAVQPGVVPAQPVVVRPQGPDEVSLAIGRLASWHESSRKEACYVLGRLGDPRAVPALVDTLKTDHSTAVRVAAATALGQMNDPGCQVYLERVITYDKKQDVRDAASAALARLRSRAEVPVQAQAQPGAYPSALNGGTAAPASAAPPAELQPVDRDAPPPPPTPVIPPLGGVRRS